MSTGSGPAGPPSDAFDAVVAGWRAEGGVPQWPDFDGPPRARDRAVPEAERGEREPARGDTTHSDALPSDALPSDALPSDALPSDALPSDALPSDALPGDAPADDAPPDGKPPGAAITGDPPRDDTLPGDARPRDTTSAGNPAGGHPSSGGSVPGVGAHDGIERSAAADPLDDDHFVPGEPPPLPRPAVPIMVGLALIVIGLVLIWAPDWIGVPQVYGLPLGLVGVAAGLGWLVLRLWPDPDGAGPPLGHDPDDPDEGAVL